MAYTLSLRGQTDKQTEAKLLEYVRTEVIPALAEKFGLEDGRISTSFNGAPTLYPEAAPAEEPVTDEEE